MSTFARVGALVAPFVPLLVFIHEAFPMFLFGFVAAIAGFLVFLLPETLGSKLPETVEEAINISKWLQVEVNGDPEQGSNDVKSSNKTS